MANLKESNIWESGIYQWETSDPVLGGADGIDNVPTRQLANRTLWLKNQVAAAVQSIGVNKQWATDELAKKADKTVNMTAGNGLTGGGTLAANRTIALGTPSTLSGATTNSVGASTHTHALAAASPTLAGVLKVLNVLTSTDGLAALSAQQGKVLADMIAKVAAGAFNFNGALGTTDLNSIDGRNVKNYGVWYQAVNVNATTARSYPVAEAGALLMLPAAHVGMQIYISYADFKIYIRSTNSSHAYSSWRELGSDKLGNSGAQVLSGNLVIRNGNWGKLSFPLAAGEWRMEFNPNADTGTSGVDTGRRLNFVFIPSSGNASYLRFDDIGNGQTVAYKSWVDTGLAGKVSKTGNEEIYGVKTFTNRSEFKGGLVFTAGNANWSSGYVGELGANELEVWLKNSTSGKFLTLKNTGDLHYGGQKVPTWVDRSDATALDDTNKFATSRAVKLLNDLTAKAATVITAGNGLTGGGTLAANRTIALGTPGKITASTTNSVGASTHTHEIDNASTSVAGVVKLNDTLSSTSTTEALTANQGRLLNNAKANKATTRAGYGITDASQVAVITGTIAHGGTLPLPSGYTAAQCKWMVSLNNDNPAAEYWDINENGSHGHYRIECWANSNRVVTARAVKNWQLSSPVITNGTANYIVIGVK